MSHLEAAYNPEERVAMPPVGARTEPLQGIEIAFGIPVYLSAEHSRQLYDLVEAIVRAPHNEPQDGVHWVSSTGDKLTFSKRDAQFMGIAVDPDAPADGEPMSNSSILTLSSSARAFCSEREKQNTATARQRAAVAAKEMAAREEQDQLAAEALEALALAAFDWWGERRPEVFSMTDHLDRPTINQPSGTEQALAIAVASAVRLTLIGGG